MQLVDRLTELLPQEPRLAAFLLEYVELAEIHANYATNTGVHLADPPLPVEIQQQAKRKWAFVNNQLEKLTIEMAEVQDPDRPRRDIQPSHYRTETVVSTEPVRGPRVLAAQQQLTTISDLVAGSGEWRSVSQFYEERGIDLRSFTYADAMEIVVELAAAQEARR